MKMDMNLKVKQLITLPAFLLLAACAGDDAAVDFISVNPGAEAKGSAICFTVDQSYSNNPEVASTRAAGREDLSRLRSDGFGVFACRTGKHPYVSSSISWNFMWNQQVTYAATDWTYSPVKYWPNETTGEEGDEYITFFAYAPYSKRDRSDKASRCIVDFSNNTEIGDAWLTYQLGGEEDDWQNHQVDLLYAVAKDQKRPEKTGQKIKFAFRHALAGAGDRVKVVCSDLFQNKLHQLATEAGADVTLTLDKVTLDYTLTRKGRLVLNNASEPNWQEIASDDPMVHRMLELTPASGEKVIATASATACRVNDYEKSDLGVFYIPMNPAGHTQQVEVTVSYSLSTGYTGSVSGVIELAVDGAESSNQDYVLTLSSRTPLSNP